MNAKKVQFCGTKREVWDKKFFKTCKDGRLTRNELILNKKKKVVSKKRQMMALQSDWVQSLIKARRALAEKGVSTSVIRGELLETAREIYTEIRKAQQIVHKAKKNSKAKISEAKVALAHSAKAEASWEKAKKALKEASENTKGMKKMYLEQKKRAAKSAYDKARKAQKAAKKAKEEAEEALELAKAFPKPCGDNSVHRAEKCYARFIDEVVLKKCNKKSGIDCFSRDQDGDYIILQELYDDTYELMQACVGCGVSPDDVGLEEFLERQLHLLEENFQGEQINDSSVSQKINRLLDIFNDKKLPEIDLVRSRFGDDLANSYFQALEELEILDLDVDIIFRSGKYAHLFSKFNIYAYIDRVQKIKELLRQ